MLDCAKIRVGGFSQHVPQNVPHFGGHGSISQVIYMPGKGMGQGRCSLNIFGEPEFLYPLTWNVGRVSVLV